MARDSYEVFVSRDTFKFNAAHFMAYPGFRERLHGHNYRVSVRVEGDLGGEGYVIDFGDIKRITKELCDEMNEKTIVPSASDCLRITRTNGQIELACEDGSHFSFPEQDCVLLPIRHSSAEELAAYVCGRLVEALRSLRERPLNAIEVSVAEAPQQEARYRMSLNEPGD